MQFCFISKFCFLPGIISLELSLFSLSNDKENVNCISKIEEKAEKQKDDIVENVVTSSETTLNLWKYIVPPHPGELEEDSFITDNMVGQILIHKFYPEHNYELKIQN